MKKLLLLAAFALIALQHISAQPETTTPFLRRLNQSTFINPAFIPEYKTSIGLPVVSNIFIDANMRGFTIGSITGAIDNNILDLNKLYDKLKGNSFGFGIYNQVDLFNIRFPAGKFSIGINLSVKSQAIAEIDKNFYGFLVNGNAYYRGQTVDFSGMKLNTMAYQELGVSIAREYEKLSWGVRLKYLQGMAYVATSNVSASFTTGANSYDPIRVQLGGTINTAGLAYLGDSSKNYNPKEGEKSSQPSDFSGTQNQGFGIDLGASYWVTPRLNVHASVVDLGAIFWKARPYNYNYSNTDVIYGGLSYDQLNNSDARTAYTDSLTALFKQSEVTRNNFTSYLSSRVFAGADYDLTLRDRVGVLLQGQFFQGTLRSAATLAYTRRIGTNWDITTNYSYFNNSFTNLGFGTSVKWGAFQIFFIQDNILLYIAPTAVSSFYLRTGFNLVWGAKRRPARV